MRGLLTRRGSSFHFPGVDLGFVPLTAEHARFCTIRERRRPFLVRGVNPHPVGGGNASRAAALFVLHDDPQVFTRRYLDESRTMFSEYKST